MALQAHRNIDIISRLDRSAVWCNVRVLFAPCLCPFVRLKSQGVLPSILVDKHMARGATATHFIQDRKLNGG